MTQEVKKSDGYLYLREFINYLILYHLEDLYHTDLDKRGSSMKRDQSIFDLDWDGTEGDYLRREALKAHGA